MDPSSFLLTWDPLHSCGIITVCDLSQCLPPVIWSYDSTILWFYEMLQCWENFQEEYSECTKNLFKYGSSGNTRCSPVVGSTRGAWGAGSKRNSTESGTKKQTAWPGSDNTKGIRTWWYHRTSNERSCYPKPTAFLFCCCFWKHGPGWTLLTVCLL